MDLIIWKFMNGRLIGQIFLMIDMNGGEQLVGVFMMRAWRDLL